MLAGGQLVLAIGFSKTKSSLAVLAMINLRLYFTGWRPSRRPVASSMSPPFPSGPLKIQLQRSRKMVQTQVWLTIAVSSGYYAADSLPPQIPTGAPVHLREFDLTSDSKASASTQKKAEVGTPVHRAATSQMSSPQANVNLLTRAVVSPSVRAAASKTSQQNSASQQTGAIGSPAAPEAISTTSEQQPVTFPTPTANQLTRQVLDEPQGMCSQYVIFNFVRNNYCVQDVVISHGYC